MICIGRCFLKRRIGRDHFARHQILADAEMLERPLRLRSPEFVGGDIDLTKAVHLRMLLIKPRLALCFGSAI
jgi:hypothetical protein